jgi:hypothetical protein
MKTKRSKIYNNPQSIIGQLLQDIFQTNAGFFRRIMHRAMFQLEPTNGRKKMIYIPFHGQHKALI